LKDRETVNDYFLGSGKMKGCSNNYQIIDFLDFKTMCDFCGETRVEKLKQVLGDKDA